MSAKKLVALAILLIIVGGVYFIDRSRVEKAKQAEEESKQIVPFKAEEVARVRVERKGEVVVAERGEGDGWKIVEPYEAAGDKSAFQSLVSGIGSGQVQRKLEEPGEPANYGLAEPAIKVSLVTKEASEEHTVLFGSKIPSGADYYAKREGEPAVFTVYSYIYTNADKSLFDFTDKSLLDFEVNDVKSFEVLAGDKVLAVDLSNEKDMRMLEPYQLRADDGDVRSLLYKVKNGRVAQFGPRKVKQSELGTYGLVDPATRVVLGFGTEGSDRSYKALLIGGATESEGRTRHYAMQEGSSDILLIEESTARDMYKEPEELRYDKLGKVRDWEANYFEFQRPGETIILTKEDTEWKMTSPREAEGKRDGLSSFLGKFSGYSGFKIRDYIASATDLSRYHLAEAPYRVTVKAEQLEESYTVSDLVLEKDEEGKSIRRVYAQWGAYPDVVLVMEETQPVIDMLKTPAEEFGVLPTPTPGPTATPAPTATAAPTSTAGPEAAPVPEEPTPVPEETEEPGETAPSGEIVPVTE